MKLECKGGTLRVRPPKLLTALQRQVKEWEFLSVQEQKQSDQHVITSSLNVNLFGILCVFYKQGNDSRKMLTLLIQEYEDSMQF